MTTPPITQSVQFYPAATDAFFLVSHLSGIAGYTPYRQQYREDLGVWLNWYQVTVMVTSSADTDSGFVGQLSLDALTQAQFQAIGSPPSVAYFVDGSI
jgi:hypothetical protein